MHIELTIKCIDYNTNVMTQYVYAAFTLAVIYRIRVRNPFTTPYLAKKVEDGRRKKETTSRLPSSSEIPSPFCIYKTIFLKPRPLNFNM